MERRERLILEIAEFRAAQQFQCRAARRSGLQASRALRTGSVAAKFTRTRSGETLHPARQPARQGLPLARFAGDRTELLPVLSPATSLRESVTHWWHANQLWIARALVVVPLLLELIYGTFLLPLLILTPILLLSTYIIYCSPRFRLQSKTNES